MDTPTGLAATILPGALQTNAAGDYFFPPLRGISLANVPRPTFSTIVQTGVDRSRTAIILDPFPLWELDLDIQHLSRKHEDIDPNSVTNPLGLTPYDQLFTLYLACAGQGGTFLLNYGFITKDPHDAVENGRQIGTGDGTTTTFQLLRAAGGFLDPVEVVGDGTLNVYVDGELVTEGTDPSTSAYTLNSLGQVVFHVAQGAGSIITADFQWLFRMAFVNDAEDATGQWFKMYARTQVLKLRQARSEEV